MIRFNQVAHFGGGSSIRLFLVFRWSSTGKAPTYDFAPVLLEMSLPVRLKNSPSFCTLQQRRSAAYTANPMSSWDQGPACTQLGIPSTDCHT